jgi:hypothetical protein
MVFFAATSVYSALNLKMGFGQPQVFPSSGLMIISVPLFVNNTGLYDLSELNMTITVTDCNKSLVSTSTTFVPSIPHGTSIETAHNVSMSPEDMTSKLQDILFNDSVLDLDLCLKLNFARAIPLQVSTNMTLPWGAPLYNFSIGQVSYNFLNFTHQEAKIPVSFENNSPYFGVDGFMRVEIHNDNGELLGFSVSDLNVPSYSGYDGQVKMIIDVSKVTGSGEVHLFFETSAFSIGPLVVQYG